MFGFLKYFIYLFLERREEREKHQCVATSYTSPTGNPAQACALAGQPLGLQAPTQSTELHQPGQDFMFYNIIFY